ncbi:hypothetical protein ACVWW4_003746 [Bradyrhizobium sp. LB7.1]
MSRIDFLRTRREDNRNADIAAQFFIAQEIARIAAEILVWSELSRIDEDANDGDVALRSARLDQGQMAIVQIAHCRHEPDAFARAASLRELTTKLGDRHNRLHHGTLHQVGLGGAQFAMMLPRLSGSR